MNCPHCRTILDDAPDLAGQIVACPHCGGQFGMGGPAPLPPPPPPIQDSARRFIDESFDRVSDYSRRRNKNPIVVAAIFCGAIGACVGALVGAGMSQFAPFLGGGLLVIADPFSPARMAYILPHVFVGSLFGAIALSVLGGALSYLRE